MERFRDAAIEALAEKNWYGALILSMTLPDICSWLETGSKDVGPRYKAWWGKYMLKHYKNAFGTALSSSDAYALRCAILHNGTGDITDQKARESLSRFMFVIPENGNIIHLNGSGTVLQLQIDIFCFQICSGVNYWQADNYKNADVIERKRTLLVIHRPSDGFVI